MATHAGKKAIVIGGSHGIGLATAQLLLNQGAQVLVTGRSPKPIEEAKQQLGDRARVVQTDITSLASITQLVEEAQAHFGAGPQLDLLYINAGYAHLEPFTAATEASFKRTMDTNVFGAFFVAQHFVPLIRDGGAIVFTSSVSTKIGFPGMSVYSASKAAVNSMVQGLAAELADRGIRVNAVVPGFVKTPTMGISGASSDDLAGFEAEGSKLTPLKRIALPEEVAKAVVFLGFEATFTTGAELPIDGGLVSIHLGH